MRRFVVGLINGLTQEKRFTMTSRAMNFAAPLDMSPGGVAKTPRLDRDTALALPLVDQQEACGGYTVCSTDGCYRKATLAAMPGTPVWVNNQAVPRCVQRCAFHGQDVLSPFIKVALHDCRRRLRRCPYTQS